MNVSFVPRLKPHRTSRRRDSCRSRRSLDPKIEDLRRANKEFTENKIEIKCLREKCNRIQVLEVFLNLGFSCSNRFTK